MVARPLPLVAAAALVLALGTAVRPQEILYRWYADAAAARMGNALADAGDVDGDGIHDIIVGIVEEDVGNKTRAGSARVFSGSDGSLLWDFDGTAANDELGWAVAGAGDLNHDGHAELLIGAYQSKGYVRVYDGATGVLLQQLPGTNPGDHFGSSVAGLGDVNGDNYDDFVVGSPYSDLTGADRGRVRVISGFDYSKLYDVFGSAPGDLLGFAVAAIGDVDGDLVCDVLAGGLRHARVLSGLNGLQIHRFDGDPAYNDNFGAHVTGLGDVSGDGVPDLAIGAPTYNGSQGSVFVYSGSDWSLLFQVIGIGSRHFGSSVGCAGDVDGDGVPDLAAGGEPPFSEYSHAWVYSGRTTRKLYRFESEDVDDRFGASVGGAGDLDGDGFDDPIVGAMQAFHRLGQEGSATVFRGNDLWLQAEDWVLNAGDIAELDVRNGPPGSIYAIFVVAVDGAPTFDRLDLGLLDSFGEAVFTDVVPPQLVGHELLVRAYALRPGPSHGKPLDSFDEHLSIR